MLHQIEAQQFNTNFPVLMSPLSQSSISEVLFDLILYAPIFRSVFFISFKSLKTVEEAFKSPCKVLEFYSYLPV